VFRPAPGGVVRSDLYSPATDELLAGRGPAIFAIGRVYLPEEDRRRFGYSDADLAAGRYNQAFVELMRFEVDRARDLFYRGLPLVEQVPAEVRVEVDLFARGGLAVLGKIERLDYNVWHRRPSLVKWEKAALFVGAVWRRWRGRAGPPAEA